jgi:hypothetical protein
MERGPLMFVVTDADLGPVPADPLAVHYAETRAAVQASADAYWARLVENSIRWWHANGHPRPLSVRYRRHRRRRGSR